MAYPLMTASLESTVHHLIGLWWLSPVEDLFEFTFIRITAFLIRVSLQCFRLSHSVRLKYSGYVKLTTLCSHTIRFIRKGVKVMHKKQARNSLSTVARASYSWFTMLPISQNKTVVCWFSRRLLTNACAHIYLQWIHFSQVSLLKLFNFVPL